MPKLQLLNSARRRADECLALSRPGLSRRDAYPQYLLRWQDNLIDGVSAADFEADMRTGDGSELEDRHSRSSGKWTPAKFCAPYSSSALAVNAFGPFRHRVPLPSTAGLVGFEVARFEYRCDNGLRTLHYPNFDLLLEATDTGGVVAVESKFLEPLATKHVDFKPQYDGPFCGYDGRRVEAEEPWRAVFEALKAGRLAYAHLDAAQLVKHYLGLKVKFKDRARTLLYVFWEPCNALENEDFKVHGMEVADFAERVSRCGTRFLAISYPALWREWESTSTWSGITAHVSRLRARYGFSLGS